ncbi:MAG: hypothetical protein IPM82_30955 [Saprospiraceae bacterium]|nr:hypothetical protein [Saprospiraceae bacterium]
MKFLILLLVSFLLYTAGRPSTCPKRSNLWASLTGRSTNGIGTVSPPCVPKDYTEPERRACTHKGIRPSIDLGTNSSRQLSRIQNHHSEIAPVSSTRFPLRSLSPALNTGSSMECRRPGSP